VALCPEAPLTLICWSCLCYCASKILWMIAFCIWDGFYAFLQNDWCSRWSHLEHTIWMAEKNLKPCIWEVVHPRGYQRHLWQIIIRCDWPGPHCIRRDLCKYQGRHSGSGRIRSGYTWDWSFRCRSIVQRVNKPNYHACFISMCQHPKCSDANDWDWEQLNTWGFRSTKNCKDPVLDPNHLHP
jgi:hypothetical protein